MISTYYLKAVKHWQSSLITIPKQVSFIVCVESRESYSVGLRVGLYVPSFKSFHPFQDANYFTSENKIFSRVGFNPYDEGCYLAFCTKYASSANLKVKLSILS